MSEISKIYSQYHDTLKESQGEYENRLKIYADKLKPRYDQFLKDFIISFAEDFSTQIKRLEIKEIAEKFFGSSEIQFVAIDASCEKRQTNNFISFYGGAYGSKGKLNLDEPGARIRYQRWEMNKDVSMVAFVPLPPDVMQINIDPDAHDEISVMDDAEISQVSSMHSKIMQLAEIYLAYSQAIGQSVEKPNLILIDNTLCGILANSSFAPRNIGLREGDFEGETLTIADMQVALAHPFNQEMQIPSTKNFQAHFRIIAEAVWKESKSIKAEDCKGFPLPHFEKGVRSLKSKEVNAGTYDESKKEFTFHTDPRMSWRKSLNIFESICEKLFRDKKASAISYKLRDSQHRRYLSSNDIKFLIGVGIRGLIELCWQKNILLVGVVKDSMSRYFYRNFLGSFLVCQKQNPKDHLEIPLTDRNIMELLPNIDSSIKAPWSTVEFDSSFLTLHPEKLEDGSWVVKGYPTKMGETTRPERIMLRSLCQFFISQDRNITSHAIFIDRITYSGWDNKDTKSLKVATESFGDILPFYYDKDGVSRLHKLTMYLLTVLVKNHYPDALGYPDPLHQADWGAKSMKRRVLGLLDSSEWAFRSKPLTKTFRTIREKFHR
ncbi:hypothetical protein J4435_01945 [Candidatus Woesearchaeota archaeon]|nr:hypothetical protein [Candidatus Woesearchaeota archaeon]